MSNFYTRMQAVATRLITNYGKQVKITRDGTTVCKPMGIWVQRDNQNQSSPNTSNISATTETNREMVLTGNFKGVPAVGDTLVEGSASYRIVMVTSVKPTDTQLAYRIEVM